MRDLHQKVLKVKQMKISLSFLPYVLSRAKKQTNYMLIPFPSKYPSMQLYHDFTNIIIHLSDKTGNLVLIFNFPYPLCAQWTHHQILMIVYFLVILLVAATFLVKARSDQVIPNSEALSSILSCQYQCFPNCILELHNMLARMTEKRFTMATKLEKCCIEQS